MLTYVRHGSMCLSSHNNPLKKNLLYPHFRDEETEAQKREVAPVTQLRKGGAGIRSGSLSPEPKPSRAALDCSCQTH